MRLFVRLNPKLTRAAREVFQVMLDLYSISGRVFPSHAGLALRARCGEKTVRRALAQFQALGVVEWTRRRRKPNVYRVVFDAAGCQAEPAPARPVVPARGTPPAPVLVARPAGELGELTEIGSSLAAFAALFAARRAAT